MNSADEVATFVRRGRVSDVGKSVSSRVQEPRRIIHVRLSGRLPADRHC